MSDLTHPSPRLSVLVIDDEHGIRKALAACLESDGHDVVAVSNGRDALAATTRKSFDLVFVDIQLGDHSGMDLIPSLLAGRLVFLRAAGCRRTLRKTWRRTEV